jgi:hypothetical protein
MADSALARMENLPVTIASLGLLYCKTDGNCIECTVTRSEHGKINRLTCFDAITFYLGVVGQDGHGLNLIDISMLPLTPIMVSNIYL